MTSTFVAPPTSIHESNHGPEPRDPSHADHHQHQSASSLNSDHLSPLLSRVDSASLSPSINQLETPAGSASTLSYYQSDLSDVDDDPFFGADFNNLDGNGPVFLDDQDSFFHRSVPAQAHQHVADGSSYPLTPDQTASLHTTSPRSERRATVTRAISETLPPSISPQELQRPFKPSPLITETHQFTPSQSSSCRSSEDGLAPAPINMPAQSPRVTVSVWPEHGGDAPVPTVERTFEDSPTTVRGGVQLAGDLISSSVDPSSASAPRDSMGIWQRDPTTGHAGLDPRSRPSDEIASINEVVSRRELDDRNQEVGRWLTDRNGSAEAPEEQSPQSIEAVDQPGNDSSDQIPLGDQTENKWVPGQTYYDGPGGQLSDEDHEIIASNRNFGDAPVIHQIKSERHQPQSSQAAIEMFERLYRDNDSILSRAATWGTRRRSMPSVFEVDGVTSGNFLKKLSLSRSGEKSSKQGSIFKDLKGLVRRPSASQLLKRTRSGSRDENSTEQQVGQERGDSSPHLVPPSRTPSWGKKTPRSPPSINTALGLMGSNFASIGTTHARSGSISGGTPSMTSPRSPRNSLTVKNTLSKRPRSKSDLPPPTSTVASPNLIDMWRKTGGPPVPALNNTKVEADEDEDEDDDFYEDSDMKMEANLIDGVKPNFAGFQQHVLTLNPELDTTSSYLIDRIAHQQIVRYKSLLSSKVKHLGQGANCPCGALCIALGGSAILLDSKGDPKGLDPRSINYDDEDGTPTEGALTQEMFPQDIPPPPTQRLPAEFECQLCYQRKKFQKPSDWTKHVHEDVQPFTCTWDKCREPKMFKRKADWVRHENEGHRHLEWWTCDVEDCRHTCFRRDNFLQHLVREHKFLEPKVKTKAALKRAGGADPTWVKVEQCHEETTKRPQDEPCRFCSKMFPTWKKLTVHLAKHMEHISLPVLRLVAAKAKELAADTIISPVQDPPPRPMIPVPVDQNQNHQMMQYPQGQQAQMAVQQMGYQQHEQYGYPVMSAAPYQQPFYTAQYESIGHNLQPAMIGPMHQGYDDNRQIHGLPVSSAGYGQPANPYMAMPGNNMGAFAQMNPLGLQHPLGPSMGDQLGGQMGGQMGYDGIIDPSSGNASPFSGQGSTSPYSHSENQKQQW